MLPFGGCVVPWPLYSCTVVCTDERYSVIWKLSPKDKPDLWRFAIIFLRSWLISFIFPMMPSKEAVTVKVQWVLKYTDICYEHAMRSFTSHDMILLFQVRQSQFSVFKHPTHWTYIVNYNVKDFTDIFMHIQTSTQSSRGEDTKQWNHLPAWLDEVPEVHLSLQEQRGSWCTCID